jgi:phenylacetate-CoA ligase
MVEEYLKSSSYGDGPALVLLGFGMGVWIGGIITLRGFEIAGARMGKPLAILPTGYNKAEIFKALRKLSPDFEQTIIVGYPPFVKELVDEAEGEGIDLTKLNIRFMFAAEAFTETFRNYLCRKAGVKDPLRDTLNIYGSADVGAMANETPLSILVRRLVIEDPLLSMDIFGQIDKTPTLAQFNPEFINFEVVDGDVVLTADSALPLIRYSIGDHGGVMTYDHIKTVLARYSVNLDAEIQKAGIQQFVNRSHPFVYVYERTDLTVTVHGINIYPEYIKECLLAPAMSPNFTERFTMSTKTDIEHNQFLQINLELQKDVEPSPELTKQVRTLIRKALIGTSSEFAEVSKSHSADALLQIVLWPNGHPRYFAPGTKQKWVEKH